MQEQLIIVSQDTDNFHLIVKHGSGQELTSEEIDLLPKKVAFKNELSFEPGILKTWGSFWIVSKDFRDALQVLDPEINGFSEVDITYADTQRSTTAYWLLIGCTHDAFDYEKTEWGMRVRGEELAAQQKYSIIGKTAFKKERLPSVNFWRGHKGKEAYSGRYCSSELKQVLEEKGVKGLRFRPCIIT